MNCTADAGEHVRAEFFPHITHVTGSNSRPVLVIMDSSPGRLGSIVHTAHTPSRNPSRSPAQKSRKQIHTFIFYLNICDLLLLKFRTHCARCTFLSLQDQSKLHTKYTVIQKVLELSEVCVCVCQFETYIIRVLNNQLFLWIVRAQQLDLRSAVLQSVGFPVQIPTGNRKQKFDSTSWTIRSYMPHTPRSVAAKCSTSKLD